MQNKFRRTCQRFTIFIVKRTQNIKCRNLAKRVHKGCFVARNHIQVAGSCFNMRKQTRTIYPFSGSQDRLEILLIVDDKIQRLQAAISGSIPKIDHFDIMILNVLDKIGPGKFLSWFVQVLDQGVGVHFDEIIHECVDLVKTSAQNGPQS